MENEQDIFKIGIGGETLTARLVKGFGVNTIEVTYTNLAGEEQKEVFEKGHEVSRQARMANGRPAEFLVGYLKTYDRLGPKLRAQIPSEWYPVLGNWLANDKQQASRPASAFKH